MNFSNHPYEDFKKIGADNHNNYVNANPFPNCYIDDFFNEKLLEEVLNEFPDLSKIADHNFGNSNEKKLATKGEYKLGPKAKEFIRFLNSHPFLDFLSSLTGIQNLIPDPELAGGGYHEIKRGGYLKVHADFNKHPKTKLDRRINVLVYLNREWKEEYGGHFELWNKEMTRAEKKILPVFNRMAIFSTTTTSYHGHPDPLLCPEGRSRKSIAMYYYTNGRPKEEVEKYLEEHTTIFKSRKGKDNTQETEKYLTEKLKTEKKLERKSKFIKIAKNITPPIIWNTLKNRLK